MADLGATAEPRIAGDGGGPAIAIADNHSDKLGEGQAGKMVRQGGQCSVYRLLMGVDQPPPRHQATGLRSAPLP